MDKLVLLLPEKADVERDGIARAWEARRGSVLRLGRFWEPPPVDPGTVRVYGNDTFCLVLADKLGLTLLSPDDDLVARAPDHLLRRKVRVSSLGETLHQSLPAFVKPIVPKQFAAAIYPSAEALEAASRGLAADVEVLVSSVVTFECEARAFVLDGEVRSCAVYEGRGDRVEAADFAKEVCRSMTVPQSCVVDVGKLAGGWCLIEFNAVWGAGLNGCDAASVLDCIAAASG